MYLNQLELFNFRNYSKQGLSFDARINIFEGANGQGKTNLLEAIYYLSTSRSFKTNYDQELARWESGGFFLKGLVHKGDNRYLVEMGYQDLNRIFQIKVNGSPQKRGDYIHQFPVVVFSPDDLLLIKEGPALRRRFINLEGSRLKPSYYHTLKSYNRALQQRNKLLKENRIRAIGCELFEPWDRALVSFGSSIIKQRISLLKNLEEQAQQFFGQLTGFLEKLTLHYCCSFGFGGDPNLIDQYFYDQLNAGRSEELRRGYTAIGPHLDDFSFLIDQYDAKKYASQGQQRTAVLALKMGEVELFHRSSKECPVVLLDDVFSEFDPERRRMLLNFLLMRQGQSFITTALPFEQHDLNKVEYKIFSVHKGKISYEGSRPVN